MRDSGIRRPTAGGVTANINNLQLQFGSSHYKTLQDNIDRRVESEE